MKLNSLLLLHIIILFIAIILISFTISLTIIYVPEVIKRKIEKRRRGGKDKC